MTAPANKDAGLERAALEYAKRGWAVFPCQPGEKRPLGGHGFRDATTDPDTIRFWWARTPNANIGLALAASGLVAIDVDDHKPDCEWSAFSKGRDIPATLTQRSARGGTHYVFTAGEHDEFPGQLCKGVDIKHHGYILVEPSVFDGNGYAWETHDDPAPVPDWVPRKAVSPPKVSASILPFRQIDTTGGRALDDLQIAKHMLAEAHNDLGRDEWVRLGLALKAVFGDLIRDDFLAFSARWSGGKVRPAEDEDFWSSAQPTGAASFGTVQHILRSRMPLQEAAAPVAPNVITPGAPQRESAFFSAADLKGKPVPPREWLVHDLVPSKTVTLFSGDGGTGKSLLALQLAIAVVAGTGWIGKAVARGRAIYLSAEDDADELHRRIADILRATGRDYDDLAGLTLRSLAGEDALLAVENQLALMQSELFEELDARAADEMPAVVVLDTLADVYPANENDRAKVRQFVGILRGLALRRQCAVVLLGHPSLTGLNSGTGTSGSTAWNNSVRSRLYLSRIADDGFEPDPDARVLSTKKANYGRVGAEIKLKWAAGAFVAEAQPEGLDKIAASAKAERVFLKLLDAFTEQGRYVSASPSSTYAPTHFSKQPGA
ncbi:MAG: bifunctional DNA primase/polymerase, partial [Pseudomonadota bacterium]